MTRVVCFATMSLVALALAACAALPDDAPVVEQLDNETGSTVTRLGHPVELYRETFVQDATGRFAFIAPFETNQMGTRDLYLWIALPVDVADGSTPNIELDGRGLALAPPGREPASAGLRKPPYRIPTPWTASFYYKVDRDLVTNLAQAKTLTIRVTEQTKEGTTVTVFAAGVTDPRLADFAAH